MELTKTELTHYMVSEIKTTRVFWIILGTKEEKWIQKNREMPKPFLLITFVYCKEN